MCINKTISWSKHTYNIRRLSENRKTEHITNKHKIAMRIHMNIKGQVQITLRIGNVMKLDHQVTLID